MASKKTYLEIANSKENGFGTVFTGEMGNATISFAGVPTLPPYPGSSLLEKVKARTKHAVLRSSALIPIVVAGHWHKAYVKNSFLRKELFFEYERRIHDQREAQLTLYETALDAKLALLQVGYNPRCTLGGLKNVTYNLSYRDPSADARVIEYCLRLPNALYFDEKGNNKQVIRHTMKGILPDEVLFSRKKGKQSADLYYRLVHYGQETEELLAKLRGSALASTWMDVPKLDKEWQLLKRRDPRAVYNCSQYFKNLSFAYYLWCLEKNFNIVR